MSRSSLEKRGCHHMVLINSCLFKNQRWNCSLGLGSLSCDYPRRSERNFVVALIDGGIKGR